MEFSAKTTHVGQYRPYGDSFKEWDITTESTDKNEVLEYCFENLYKRRVPESAEYHRNICYGAARSGDANYYFAGYYELTKIAGGYHFKVCEPWTD